jgi:hypothetical protein
MIKLAETFCFRKQFLPNPEEFANVKLLINNNSASKVIFTAAISIKLAIPDKVILTK